MPLLLNSGDTEFLAQNLTGGKIEPGVIVLMWENTEGRDVSIRVQIKLGKEGGLLADTSTTTFTFKFVVGTSYLGSGPYFLFQTIVNHDTYEEDDHLSYILDKEIFVPDGEYFSLRIHSSNANDSDVDGDVYLIDTQAGIDVRAVGGETPFNPSSDAVANVTLVDTTTTNTDMRGTDSAALASVCTEARLAELASANLPADVDAVKAKTDIAATEAKQDTVQTDVTLAKKLLQADTVIDTSNSSQWVLIFKEKGTETEILRKNLKDIDGNPIAASQVIVGGHEHTASP